MGYDISCVGGLEGLESPEKWDPFIKIVWEQFGQEGKISIPPRSPMLFRTGFKQAIPKGWGCLFWDRGGLGAIKLVHRFAGVVDSNYRGEWFVRLFNFSNSPVEFAVGDRIVQGIYQQQIHADFPVVDTLDETARGAGAFGSTGK